MAKGDGSRSLTQFQGEGCPLDERRDYESI